MRNFCSFKHLPAPYSLSIVTMSMVKLLRHCGGRSDSGGDGEDGGGRRVAGSPRDVGDAGGGCSHSTFSMAWMEGRVG